MSPVLALVGFVGLCLLVGAAEAAIVTGQGSGWYHSLARPAGTLPDRAFAPVWTFLYITIGVAGWLAWRHTSVTWPLRLWGWQLAANALWAPAFFALHSPPLALAVCGGLLLMIVLTMLAFARVHRPAAWLLVPYLGWAGYASYLTTGFWWLNQA